MKTVMRPVLISMLLLSEVSILIWTVSTGIWDVRFHLPLQLCTISLFLSIFMLISKKKWLVDVVYFFGIAGATQAILTPDLYYSFPHFRYWHFFIAHIAIILSILYMIWVEGFRLTVKSAIRSYIFLNVIALFVFGINYITGANYMFLSHKPEGPSILDFLGPYPWYILQLQLIVVLMYGLLYLPFHFIRHREINKQKEGAN